MNFEQQKNIIKSFLTEFNSFTEKEGVNTKLIAVSKKKPLQLIEVANKLGINHFGENYPQELRDKDLDKAKKNLDLSWHFIGKLQKNKIKYVAGKAFLIHSVDTLELASNINDYCQKFSIVQRILLQVNISNDPNKSGFSKENLSKSYVAIKKFKYLQVCGFMTILDFNLDEDQTRENYKSMRELSLQFQDTDLLEISMGMSNDYKIAIQEGSTIVRVGTKIFGPR